MVMIEVTTPKQGELDQDRVTCYQNVDEGSYAKDGSGNLTADPISFTMEGGTISRSFAAWNGSTGMTAKEVSP